MLLHLDILNCPEELRPGLAAIAAEYPRRFPAADGALTLSFLKQDEPFGAGLSVTEEDGGLVVRYGRRTDAFRAVGRLLGMEDEGRARQGFSESPRFDMLGAMLDVSRNGVLTVASVESLMRRFALMGLDTLMLYTKDTYEVPGEPIFGYLRGAYSEAELRQIDDRAYELGIEVIPCIQTLGHLEPVLQWPAYAEYRDTDEIILAEWEKSYELLEKMIRAISSPLRSSRIHIGMDETFNLGSGRYRKLYGDKPRFNIFNDHLKRMLEICRRQQLSPMIWSDMYFRVASKVDAYYDKEAVMSEEVASAIPREVELVYWDYYHKESDFYEDFIDRHRNIGFDPVMAGGVWTWSHFWAALPFSFTVTDACMSACKKKNLRQAFVTMWGDDGMECDIYSALPGIQLFAEHCYADEVDPGQLRSNFRGSCQAEFDDWVMGSLLDKVPGVVDPEDTFIADNISKWLLWQDPLLSLMDPHVEHLSLRGHYTDLAAALFEAAGKGAQAERLLLPAHLARVLALKFGLRREMAEAYLSGNRGRLQQIAGEDLPALRLAVDELWQYHRRMWLSTCKPFGLEVLECRYGGLRTRLESLADRLESYLSGATESIPELEVRLEKVCEAEGSALPYVSYERVATPSFIK